MIYDVWWGKRGAVFFDQPCCSKHYYIGHCQRLPWPFERISSKDIFGNRCVPISQSISRAALETFFAEVHHYFTFYSVTLRRNDADFQLSSHSQINQTKCQDNKQANRSIRSRTRMKRIRPCKRSTKISPNSWTAANSA